LRHTFLQKIGVMTLYTTYSVVMRNAILDEFGARHFCVAGERGLSLVCRRSIYTQLFELRPDFPLINEGKATFFSLYLKSSSTSGILKLYPKT